jgi:shikimate kinase
MLIIGRATPAVFKRLNKKIFFGNWHNSISEIHTLQKNIFGIDSGGTGFQPVLPFLQDRAAMTKAKSGKKFNIVLIGYRAVGKTTVGEQVAQMLGRTLVDLDAILEQEAGEPIADLVSREGWPEFRRREKEVVQRYASSEGMVLATGGGVVLDKENTALLKATGKLIWLRALPATIKARLSRDIKQTEARPGLTAKGTLDEIDEVLAAREPLYQDAATVSLAVDTASVAEVARHIVALVRAWEQENQ